VQTMKTYLDCSGTPRHAGRSAGGDSGGVTERVPSHPTRAPSGITRSGTTSAGSRPSA
jgi:hypothetical protein